MTAYPYLQNLDLGPNGTGLEYEDWCAMFGGNGCSEFAGTIDEKYMDKERGWTEKEDENSKWNPEECVWRVEVIKEELKEIMKEKREGREKGKEVVMVTHGSFLRKIVGSGEFSRLFWSGERMDLANGWMIWWLFSWCKGY